MKFSEERMGINLLDHGFGNGFLDVTPELLV